MFFATQGGCWVYFALHHGLLPPSECIPLHKCLPLYDYIRFRPIVAQPGCSPCWSLRYLPQTIHTKKACFWVVLHRHSWQPKGPLQDVSTASVPQANGVGEVSWIRAWTSEPALPNQNIVEPPLPPLWDAPFPAPTPTRLARFKPRPAGRVCHTKHYPDNTFCNPHRHCGGHSPPLSLPWGPVPPSLSSSTLVGCSIPRSNTNPLSQIQTPHPQGESATPSTTLIIPSATDTATPGGLSPPLSLPWGPVPPSLSSSTLAGCSIYRVWLGTGRAYRVGNSHPYPKMSY